MISSKTSVMIQLPVGNVSLPATSRSRHVKFTTLVRSTREHTNSPSAVLQQCSRRSILLASTVILQIDRAQQAFAAPPTTDSLSKPTAEAFQDVAAHTTADSGNFFVDWPYARCSQKYPTNDLKTTLVIAKPVNIRPRPLLLSNLRVRHLSSSPGPQDILPFLYATSTPGDPASVLAAIEEFSTHYPMYIVGHDKATLLREIVRAAAPHLVVEVGSFIGYSAVTIASTLPPGGHMVCVDACPDCVETARAVVELAGLSEKVTFELGLSNLIAPGLAARYGAADVVFEDHCKECYARDLVLMEKGGLVVNGTWLVADNVLYPGAPDLLAALRDRERYAAALVPYKYEYDQAWNPNWDPKADAMSVAISLGQPLDLEAAAMKIKALCETVGKGTVM